MSVEECKGVFRNFALFSLDDTLGDVYCRAMDGVTGLLKPLIVYAAPTIVGSFMEHGTSYEWNYVAPNRQGIIKGSASVDCEKLLLCLARNLKP